MSRSVCLCLAFLAVFSTGFTQSTGKARDARTFEIRIYHFSDSTQEGILDRYIQSALMPALARKKIYQVGAFKTLSNDTARDKTLYVFLPFTSVYQSMEFRKGLAKDASYMAAGREYINADAKHPAYTRFESIWLEAFPMSSLTASGLKSASNERIYELRSYESASEELGQNKIRMFVEGGEIALFNRLGFDAAFYGKVISGAAMPNLMYLTRFENREARDAHWKAFGEDAEWKKLSALPEYKDNVSHIDIIFLRPTVYSAL